LPKRASLLPSIYTLRTLPNSILWSWTLIYITARIRSSSKPPPRALPRRKLYCGLGVDLGAWVLPGVVEDRIGRRVPPRKARRWGRAHIFLTRGPTTSRQWGGRAAHSPHTSPAPHDSTLGQTGFALFGAEYGAAVDNREANEDTDLPCPPFSVLECSK